MKLTELCQKLQRWMQTKSIREASEICQEMAEAFKVEE